MSECIAIRHQPWVGGLAGVVLFRDGERERERERWCAATLQRYMIGTD